MYLEITDEQHLSGSSDNLKDFAEFVKEEMITRCQDYSTYDVELVEAWNSYIKKNLHEKLDFFKIAEAYFTNLLITKKSDYDFLIEGNPDLVLEGFEVDVLVAMINDGNLEMMGYPYFQTTFDLYEELVPILYKQWGL
jgi:hypothetical protein